MADPSFYCENCGQKVSWGQDTCPGCGQEFDFVLCPSCGFTGEAALFQGKCPQCGYFGAVDISLEKKPYQRKQLSTWVYRILILILIFILIGLVGTYLLL